jgi:hypothetical protein
MWNDKWGTYQRSHYIAYAFEGMWRSGLSGESVAVALGELKPVIERYGCVPYLLMRGWEPVGDDICIPATAQFALLYAWVGEYELSYVLADYVSVMWHTDPVSWTLKYLLDAYACAGPI